MKQRCYLIVVSFFFFLPFFLNGCGSVTIHDNLFAGLDILSAAEQKEIKEIAECKIDEFDAKTFYLYPKLEAAYRQIKTGVVVKSDTFKNIIEEIESKLSPDILAKNSTFKKIKDNKDNPETNPLPDSFAKNSMISKMIIYTRDAIRSGEVQSLTVSREDIKEMVQMICTSFDISQLNKNEEQLSKDSLKSTVQSYLYEYFVDEKGFVDRDGTMYATPEFKGKIENSTITAIVGIFWEAIADDLLRTPVWSKKTMEGEDKYFTKGNLQPTALKLKKVKNENVVELGAEGIDENDLKFMRYLSGLAGEQSKILSGSLCRAFGKVNVGFVIEGGFSFGDNETLAKVLETSFEVVAKRSTLESIRHFFQSVSCKYDENTGFFVFR